MPRPHRALLVETAAQVNEHVNRLATHHSLPRESPENDFWWRAQDAIVATYLAQAETHGAQNGKAIIMAGAPGAGKSRAITTAQQALGPDQANQLGLDEAGFITIDADDVKQLLLGNPIPHLPIDATLLSQARHEWDNLIQRESPNPLPDGNPLLRGELALLVHGFSNTIAEKARQRLLDKKYNVKIEGTLQWDGQGPKLAAELDKAEYSQVTICMVDTPEAQCQEGAFQRWAQPRAAQDPTARYTPPTVVSDPFGPDGNRCRTNAKHTQTTIQELSIPAHLVTVDRAKATVQHVKPDGTSHTYQIPKPTVSAAVAASRPPTRRTPKPNIQRATQTKPTTTRPTRKPNGPKR